MPEINPLTNNQIFLKKIAENTGSDYDTGDVSEINPLTIDQIFLKEIAENTAGQSGDITELEGKVADNTAAIGAIVNVTGSCNVMPNNAVTTTVWGVTFTVNADKTIAVSGTPEQRLVYIPIFDHYLLKAGTYIVSSALPSSSYIFISLSRQSDSVEIATTTLAEDGKFEFTLDADIEIKGDVGCYVPADKPPVSGVIKPMLYDARLNPTGYVSPAMTNRELTDAVGLLSNLNTTAKSNLVSAINEISNTTSVTTGDINELLTENNPYRVSFITVLAQAGGYTITNWIGNVDGYIVKLGVIAIAFNGWDLSARPYYKFNWGGWSQWYQF